MAVICWQTTDGKTGQCGKASCIHRPAEASNRMSCCTSATTSPRRDCSCKSAKAVSGSTTRFFARWRYRRFARCRQLAAGCSLGCFFTVDRFLMQTAKQKQNLNKPYSKPRFAAGWSRACSCLFLDLRIAERTIYETESRGSVFQSHSFNLSISHISIKKTIYNMYILL